MSVRRVLAPALAVFCDLGFLAAVASVYKGMRDLMATSGVYCASGGPYAIAATAWARWSGFGTAMAFWAIAFGALGWNFLSLGFTRLHGQSDGAGWIVCGVVFWGMAAGGAVPESWPAG